MIKYVLATVLAVATIFGVQSCALLSEGGPPLVVTTEDNVQEERLDEATPVPVDLPEDVLDDLPEDAVVVVVPEDAVKDPEAPAVKLGGDPVEDDTTFNTLLEAGLDIAGGFIPGLAAWEGVITLFSRRKRRHYLDSLKKAAPLPGDTKIDLVGAVASLGKAIGAGHSSEGTAEVYEAEKELEKAETA